MTSKFTAKYYRPNKILLVTLFALFAICFWLLSKIKIEKTIEGIGITLTKGQIWQVSSPFEGVVDQWLIEEGDTIKLDQVIATIRPRKNFSQKISIKSKHQGVVSEIIAHADQRVDFGDPLALISPHGDLRNDLEVLAFVSPFDAKRISQNMPAKVFLSIAHQSQEGFIHAHIKNVGKLPSSKSALNSLVKIPELTKTIQAKIAAEPFVVRVALEKNSQSKSGYRFSRNGINDELDPGILAKILVVYEKKSAFEYLFSFLVPNFLIDKI